MADIRSVIALHEGIAMLYLLFEIVLGFFHELFKSMRGVVPERKKKRPL